MKKSAANVMHLFYSSIMHLSPVYSNNRIFSNQRWRLNVVSLYVIERKETIMVVFKVWVVHLVTVPSIVQLSEHQSDREQNQTLKIFVLKFKICTL